MLDTNAPDTPHDRGLFEARYLAFLETIAHLRPSLHRYCARMTGSVTDGEDVVQEALFHAYRRLDAFDDARPLKPWLFRIAHNAASTSCAAVGCEKMRKPRRRPGRPTRSRPTSRWARRSTARSSTSC